MPQFDYLMLAGTHRHTALFSQVLKAMSIVTPVAIRAVPKLHELVTQPGLVEELSAGWLTILGITV